MWMHSMSTITLSIMDSVRSSMILSQTTKKDSLMNKKLIENQLNNNTVGYVGGLMDNQERQNVINVFLCKKKKRTLQLFKSGFVRVFISTDVASRGIDVEVCARRKNHVQNIPYIINMNIPLDVETYVHRAGRGGRTGGGIPFHSSRWCRSLYLHLIDRHHKGTSLVSYL